LIGYRDYLDDDIEQGYRKAGCAHVLALSGMHLAVITALLALALKGPLGLKAAAVVGGLVVFLYVLFVGPQPSLVRSVLMYLLGATALVVGLPRPTASILALAFLGQIGADPTVATSLSFILSYLALGGILFFSEGLAYFLRPFLGPALAPSLAASLGAFLATMAVVGSLFGVLYPIGLGASLVVVPLAILMMLGTLLWFPLHFALPPVAFPLTGLLNLIYGANGTVITLASRASFLPISQPIVLIPLTLAISLVLVYVRYGPRTKRNRLEPFN
jgi:competence protein ComEC